MASVLPVDVVGVSHVGGKYNFTEMDFLNEGAQTLHDLGCKVIKVWFMGHVAKSYPFNTQWPKVSNLVELAKTKYFADLFARPFDTFILETYAPGRRDHYYLGGMSPEQIERERSDLRDLAAHLLHMYKGAGKTFVIQNWEGDWSLRGGAPGEEPTPTAVKGMIDWFNARQQGVNDARGAGDAGDAAKVGGVRVLHAAEVNHVARAMTSEGITVTNDVLPHTKCDLYSYSAYDVPTPDPDKFKAALDYLASKAPGDDNIYVGEYGAPENMVGGAEEQDKRIRSATRTALDWGAKYIVYWQLYCNEPKQELKGRPKNAEMKGFWMIRPDGSRPPVCDYFIELWNRR